MTFELNLLMFKKFNFICDILTNKFITLMN